MLTGRGCSRPLAAHVPGLWDAAKGLRTGLCEEAGASCSGGEAMAQDRERRAAPRTNMERHAMFVAIDGSTLLQSAVVTDMSRDGLHLRTRQPAPIGTVIEIEMEPRASATSSAPVIVRGRIVRVQELRDGEYSVGVKLRYRIAKTDAPRAKAATGLPPLKPASGPKSTSTRKQANLDWRQWAVLGVFVAVIGLMLLWPRQNTARAVTGGAGRGTTSNSPQEAIAETMKRLRTPNTGSGGQGSASDRTYNVLPLLPPEEPRKNGENRVSKHDAPLSGNTLGDQKPEANQSVRFANDDDLAVDSLEPANPAGPDGALLAGGIETREQRGENLRRFRIDPAAIAHIPNGVALLASARRAEQRNSHEYSGDKAPEIVLIVDRSDFTLTVVRDGRFAAQYPISIGANDSTPTGTFTIHNKIRNPDWYNRGETVPHGDPRNPLGGFWMGFAKDGKPLSYGIHATTDASLIGQPTGRGCVRLKSEHTDELFQSCDIGAKVVIR